MRLRVLFASLLSVVLSCLIVFSGVSLRASAFTDGVYISAASLHDLLGDTLSAEICDASFGSPEIRTFTLTYNGPVTVSGSDSADIPDGWGALQYSAYVPNLVNNPSYITVDFSPFFSVSDTFQLHSFVAVGGSGSSWTTAIPPYQSPQWRVHISGLQQTFEGVSGDTLTSVRLLQSGVYNHYFHTVTADIAQNTAFDFSSVRVTFSDVHTDNNMLYVLVGCPYVSPDAVPSSGTIATTASTSATTTTTAINVNVDVDLDDTNSLLEDILEVLQSWLSAVGEVISSLWVPPATFYAQFRADLVQVFNDAFGGSDNFDIYYGQFISTLQNTSPVSSLHFPGLSVPVGSDTVELIKPQDVSFIPSGLGTFSIMGTEYTLIDFIKFMFDLVFTIAFVNTIRNKLRAIIFGTTVVEQDDEQG